jgi:hypothetical protein
LEARGTPTTAAIARALLTILAFVYIVWASSSRSQKRTVRIRRRELSDVIRQFVKILGISITIAIQWEQALKTCIVTYIQLQAICNASHILLHFQLATSCGDILISTFQKWLPIAYI